MSRTSLLRHRADRHATVFSRGLILTRHSCHTASSSRDRTERVEPIPYDAAPIAGPIEGGGEWEANPSAHHHRPNGTSALAVLPRTLSEPGHRTSNHGQARTADYRDGGARSANATLGRCGA